MIPLAKYGYPEIAKTALGCALLALPFWFLWKPGLILPLIIFGFVLSFFRSPNRKIPEGEHLLVSPADGKVTDIEEVDEPDYIGGRALRIGIFLSVLNAHVNRAPAAGKVEFIRYKEGKYLNALKPESAKVNESNFIGMYCPGLGIKIGLKQISGAIARRIVCDVKIGRELDKGEIMGMIKFGSRTDLYIPIPAGGKTFKPRVNIGDMVKAGSVIIGELS